MVTMPTLPSSWRRPTPSIVCFLFALVMCGAVAARVTTTTMTFGEALAIVREYRTAATTNATATTTRGVAASREEGDRSSRRTVARPAASVDDDADDDRPSEPRASSSSESEEDWLDAARDGLVLSPAAFADAVVASPSAYLVLEPSHGLGNRLRAIAAGARLARTTNRTLIVVSYPVGVFNATLSSLFTTSFLRAMYADGGRGGALLEASPRDAGLYDARSALRRAFSVFANANRRGGKKKGASWSHWFPYDPVRDVNVDP
jgi:hypothetical protein